MIPGVHRGLGFGRGRRDARHVPALRVADYRYDRPRNEKENSEARRFRPVARRHCQVAGIGKSRRSNVPARIARESFAILAGIPAG